MSSIKINSQAMPFGHAVITLGPAVAQPGVEDPVVDNKKVYYQEPSETASFSYEILYRTQEGTYVTPSHTPQILPS